MATPGYPLPAPVIAVRIRALGTLDPTGAILVAAGESGVLGFATLHATPVLRRPTAVGRVTGIAVLPEAQGAGAGRLLVAAAEQFFAAMALERIEITSGPTHLTAHAFYRHLGYDDQAVRFVKPLGPRPSAG